ncbi:hypothetical protein [Deinococcus roseus]|uniref:Uncharacterized protein n=1 Tax=Deinococcus roseus TaxID=392414 RepID=A0ABQ2CV85_9DEIO|nr:hypothetical protein [Deinococcus roseus]GGJ23570.1 hypothetical protein GCM10008938_07180 [Deinococcus roseus]
MDNPEAANSTRHMDRLLDLMGEIPKALWEEHGLLSIQARLLLVEHLVDTALLLFKDPGMHFKQLPVESIEASLRTSGRTRLPSKGAVAARLGSMGASFLGPTTGQVTFLQVLLKHTETQPESLPKWFDALCQWFAAHASTWREGFLQHGGTPAHLYPALSCLEHYLQRLEHLRRVEPARQQLKDLIHDLKKKGALQREDLTTLREVEELLEDLRSIHPADELSRVLRSPRLLAQLSDL